MLSERQKHLASEISRECRRHGAWLTSWPRSRYLTYEVLDEDVGAQLARGFQGYGMLTCFVGAITRVTPTGVVPAFAFQVTLPRDKPLAAPRPFDALASGK